LTDTLSARLQRLLDAGHQDLLRGGLTGLEKESLRVSPEGGIARTAHPEALGSALTHPWITTDYSEALLEFITPPFADAREALAFLRDLQTFTYPRIGEEFLWATSMPCVLAGEEAIPVARYGSSNAGRMKTVYRLGLGYRYGRVMQVIAGVHFNYSLPEAFWPVYQRLEGDSGDPRRFSDARYFAMIRNLQRLGWMVPYLFGASPAVCKSFLGGKPTHMPEFNENTYYEPYATSLRMGDIGYQNRKEEETGIKASYDSLEAYTDSLACAIDSPSPVYEKIGVVVDGEYRQLNANILQIENEYYSSVRPKPVMEGNEKPVVALRRRGVRYVELRSIDVNAFEPLGVCETQLRFLEAFMLTCLLMDSPLIGEVERLQIDHNQSAAAHRGRDPNLKLLRNGDQVSLRTWAGEVLDAMSALCAAMDGDDRARPYSSALERQREKVDDPSLTPSARMLAEMAERREGFYEFARRLSRQHQDHFRGLSLAPETEARFEVEARASAERQRRIEASDECSFEEYLRRYFAQTF
jgi:glutamate--cysteine ligase